MTHKYEVGDWIAFSSWRCVGTLNEHVLVIEPIMFLQAGTTDSLPAGEPAYVTNSGRTILQCSILEVRKKQCEII